MVVSQFDLELLEVGSFELACWNQRHLLTSLSRARRRRHDNKSACERTNAAFDNRGNVRHVRNLHFVATLAASRARVSHPAVKNINNRFSRRRAAHSSTRRLSLSHYALSQTRR